MTRFIRDIKKYWRYVIYAGGSELKTEIANSYLNWLWWIIEPLCFMLIYSFVFIILFGSKIDHANVFVYIGITLWDFFSRMLQTSVKCVRNYKPIVSKVYIPKYMLLLVKVVINGFKLCICLALLFIMMLVTGIAFSVKMLWLIPILLTLLVFTFGVCTILLHFGVYVDDLHNVTTIVLKMLFYLTGVFYDLESKLTNIMSAHFAHLAGNLNPMACLITSTRSVILYGADPNVKYLVFWLAIGLVLSGLGIHLIYRNENSYVKVI